LLTLEKILFWLFLSSKVNSKVLATKKLKLQSESLDNFASCHAAIFIKGGCHNFQYFDHKSIWDWDWWENV
jgi:hypothetical protein